MNVLPARMQQLILSLEIFREFDIYENYLFQNFHTVKLHPIYEVIECMNPNFRV